MIRIVLSFCLSVGLTACGSISHPLPECDGYSRRPLNRAVWQWQNNGGTEQPTTGALPAQPTGLAVAYVEDPLTSVAPAAFAPFDIAGSYRPCEGR
ncbi:type IV secretion system lipoprotein VirB7 (plasmid) [Rhizobium sp. NXC14]|uniref:hypothetical protein n=1 Tax=Rhizobium sp. NXC14 TaxID=1981173 RepID=UPI000A20252E|nr:hypothetical protein [Rhizobium sp. NXC14]ARO34372.1 type IV secretion system lipoprotein VirB7 [Rhizobium sp. NXC14]